MAYSPKRAVGVTVNTRRAEAEAIGARLPNVNAHSVAQQHLATHYNIGGDSPASYVATLGTAQAAIDFSPRVASRDEIRHKNRADSISFGTDPMTIRNAAPVQRVEPRQMRCVRCGDAE
jgi:hypothetical protein